MKPTALYRFYGHKDELLYVGISHRLNERISAHKKQKPWTQVAKITVEHHQSRAAAVEAEKQAIQGENPEWNVVHNKDGATTITPNELAIDEFVGHCFHTFSEEDDGCRLVKWQGQIVGRIEPGVYLVELFEWMMGEPSIRLTIPLQDMIDEGWQFYDSAEWMDWAYQYRLKDATDRHVKHDEVGR